MRTTLRGKVTLLFIMLAVLIAVPGAAALAQDTSTPAAPTIQSDKADYSPGDLVTLTGSGWVPGESVHINVNDTFGATWSRNVDVTADMSGNITDSFNLPNSFVSDYDVTATGAQSGTATATFTDSNPQSLTVANPPSTTQSVAQGSTATYGNVTVDFTGNSTPCNLTLGASTEPAVTSGPVPLRHPADTGLPTGATANFTPSLLQGVGGESKSTTSFTVSTMNSTPTGTYTFHVKGTRGTGCNGSDPVSQAAGADQTLTLIVTSGVRPTTTTVTSSSTANTSTYGDNVTFTATVTATGGNPTNQGTVTFKDGTTTLCSGVALSSGQATCGPTSALGAGNHTITADYSGTSSGTPQFAASTGSLTQTVNKKELTVTADPQTITYGQADPSPFTFQYSGFVNGENSSVIDTPPTCGVAGAHTNAGTYDITCSGGLDNNYSFKYVKGTLTVNKKELTVTANNQTKILGQSDPAFTFAYSGGFVSPDTSADIDTPPTCGVSVTHTNVGSYPIVCSGGSDNNYSFKYVDGTLKILYAGANTQCLGSAGHTILQPINKASEMDSTFKQGSTVPAKFRVCDANGNSIGTPGVVTSFKLVKTINGTESTTVNEDVLSTTPDTEFRWSSTDQQWIFNINTKKLAAGKTYVYQITLNDTTTIDFQFGLR